VPFVYIRGLTRSCRSRLTGRATGVSKTSSGGSIPSTRAIV